MDRRSFVKTGLAATTGFVALGPTVWRAWASHPAPMVAPEGRYGPPSSADEHGLRLPAGFSSREIARANEPVLPRGTPWHRRPDGGAVFPTPDGGWIYTSNSEVGNEGGGAGAVRFGPDGTILDAYLILSGTTLNCAGGATPWGTWLSCEETVGGIVWECDPFGVAPARRRLGLGTFKHEAAVVDPQSGYVYLTEDQTDGCLYRFRPAEPLPSPLSDLPGIELLDDGTLEVARVSPGGTVTWIEVPNPFVIVVNGNEITTPTRRQVAGARVFRRGEGAWFDTAARIVFFCTTGDETVWALHVDTDHLEPMFESDGSLLNGADNISVAASGDIFICEDHGPSSGPLQLVMIDRSDLTVSPFLEAVGSTHEGSELTGVAFDPSGTRMYLSSQRGYGEGATYEVSGPFRP